MSTPLRDLVGASPTPSFGLSRSAWKSSTSPEPCISPTEMKADGSRTVKPNATTNPTIYHYKIVIHFYSASTGEGSTAERQLKSQIRKKFSKTSALADEKQAVRVDNTNYMSAQQLPSLKLAFIVPISRSNGTSGSHRETGEEYFKLHLDRTTKNFQFAKLGQFARFSHTWVDPNAKLSDDRTLFQRVTRSEPQVPATALHVSGASKDSVDRFLATFSSGMRKERGKDWTDVAIVYACESRIACDVTEQPFLDDHQASSLRIHLLRTWLLHKKLLEVQGQHSEDSQQNESIYEAPNSSETRSSGVLNADKDGNNSQGSGNTFLSQICPNSPCVSRPAYIIFRDCVLDPPSEIGHGLQKREGLRISPSFKKMDEQASGLCATEEKCEYTFLKTIPVSEFLTHHFGADVSVISEARVYSTLEGVHVDVMDSTFKNVRIRSVKVDGHKVKILPQGCAETITLGEVYERHRRYPLTSMHLPWIDVGPPSKPYYVPAELCMICESQLFCGRLPGLRKLGKDQIKKPEKPTPFYSNVSLGTFDLIFAEIVILPESECVAGMIKSGVHVTGNNWKAFQNEIGARFGSKLKPAVDRSKSIVLTAHSKCNSKRDEVFAQWKEQILNGCKQLSAANKVVIACIPDGGLGDQFHSKLKTICDLDIGVLSKIVKATTVNDYLGHRLDKQEKFTSKRLTGQIVRDMYASVMIPAEEASELPHTQVSTDKASNQAQDNTLIVGLHVATLSHLLHPSNKAAHITKAVLITVTSTFSGVERNFSTTHHLVKDYTDSLAAHVEIAVQHHIDKAFNYLNKRADARPRPTRVRYYRSGHFAKDRKQLGEELMRLSSNSSITRHLGSQNVCELTYVSVVTDATIKSVEGVQLYANDSGCFLKLKNGEWIEKSLNFNKTFIVSQHVMNALAMSLEPCEAVAAVYRRKVSDTPSPGKPLLFTACYKMMGGELSKAADVTTLDSEWAIRVARKIVVTTLPDILQLTLKASKYAQKYIRMVENTGDLDLPPIHEDLSHLIYFL